MTFPGRIKATNNNEFIWQHPAQTSSTHFTTDLKRGLEDASPGEYDQITNLARRFSVGTILHPLSKLVKTVKQKIGHEMEYCN